MYHDEVFVQIDKRNMGQDNGQFKPHHGGCHRNDCGACRVTVGGKTILLCGWPGIHGHEVDYDDW